jgi:4-hydroxy-tetrahydrodipicolinate synthase
MEKLKGVYPPVITFFDQEGNVELENMKRHADFLIEKGVDGLTFFGTTGEFSSLTLEEKKQIIKELHRYINGRVKIFVGVGDTCVNYTIDLIRFIEPLKIDAVLLINPYYAVHSDEMVKNYITTIALATSLKIIVYNFPDLTGYNISHEMMRELVQSNENIVGIKDTVKDFEHVCNMIALKSSFENFSVFCAFENQALGALVNGVDGFINATANFLPEFTIGTYQAYQKGNHQETEKWYQKMCQGMDFYNASQPMYLACKQGVYERLSVKKTGERVPAMPLKEQTVKYIQEKLKVLLDESR